MSQQGGVGQLLAWNGNTSDVGGVTTPLSNIRDVNAENTVYLRTRGHFNIVSSPTPGEQEDLYDRCVERGGYQRTSSNRGTIACDKANLLFSETSGGVGLILSLPYPVVSGVYQPLINQGDRVLTDMIMWGVNFGDVYITLPGFYAAFTPRGIEFTVWTTGGQNTIRDVSSNLPANTDCKIECIWNKHYTSRGHTMEIFVNGVMTAFGYGTIDEYSLGNLYTIVSGASESSSEDIKNANFYLLDNPAGKNGLDCILRRLEIFNKDNNLPVSAVTRGIPRTPRTHPAYAEITMTFIGCEGPGVSIVEPEFNTVVLKNVDLLAVGDIGIQRQSKGQDAGVEYNPQTIPVVPEDLPLGFTEVRGAQ